MSKNKVANSYSILRVLEDGTLKIEEGGLNEARKAKKAVEEAAKANPGVTFVEAKVGKPVQYKEVVTYELVNAELDIHDEDDSESKASEKDDKKVNSEKNNSDKPKEDKTDKPKEDKPKEDKPKEDKKDIPAKPEADAVSTSSEGDTESEEADDGSSFDQLFADPGPSDKPAEKPELF